MFWSQDFSRIIHSLLNSRQWVYLHQFGVMASVDNNSHNPLCVSQLGTTQQHLVWTQGSWTEKNKNKQQILKINADLWRSAVFSYL